MVRKDWSLVIGPIFLLSVLGLHIQAASLNRKQPGVVQQSGSNNRNGVKRDSLLNGLQMMVLERPGTGKVTVHLRVNSGGMFDLANKGGLADITAGMLLRGGSGVSAKGVADVTSQLGLTISVAASWDSTDLVITGPSSEFDAIMDLLAKLVLKPTFDQKELDSLKEQRVSELLTEHEPAGQVALNQAMATLFGSYPFGHPVTGSADSIGKITRDDLVLYHSRFYIPNNSELVVEGDVQADDVTTIARTRLGPWGKGAVVPPTFVPPAALTRRKIVIIDKAAQRATGVVAEIGASRRAEDYLADMIVSRLLADLASKNGASLGAKYTSLLDARYLAGPLTVQIDAPVENFRTAVQTVLTAMTALGQGGASADDVNRVKQDILSSFESRSSSDSGMIELLLDIEQYGLGRDYLLNFAERVNAVSSEEIAEAARKHLNPASLAIAVVGQADRLQTALANLGSVSVEK